MANIEIAGCRAQVAACRLNAHAPRTRFRAAAWRAELAWAAIAVVVPAMAADTGPSLKQTSQGVSVAGDLVPGSTLIREYRPYAPGSGATQGEDRARNRATVAKFLALPIGEERARLYADDGVKQLPALGIQWPGLDGQLKNNEQNRGRYPGWKWTDVTISNTDDPTVFWVEANGATAPGMKPEYANHYVMQFVVRGGKIALFREFGTPVRVTR